MFVKNLEEIVFTQARGKVVSLANFGIESVRPELVMRSVIGYQKKEDSLYLFGERLPLWRKRIFVLGGGKAAGEMARVLENILTPERIEAGLVTCKVSVPTTTVDVIEAGHPIPDERGASAVERMLRFKEEYDIGNKDIIICLLSGGGSALLPSPADGISLKDLKQTNEVLVSSGADINEINCIRKHISKIKGGQLAAHFYPAQVISLIISDVVGNDLGSIASGPTAPDESTFQDAWDVLERYNLTNKVPNPIVKHIRDGVSGLIEDTPKQIINCDNHIIADISKALKAVAQGAKGMGLRPKILTSKLHGDPSDAANMIALDIAGGRFGGYDLLLAGGETTPSLPPDHGKGGRNQHFVAVSMLAMEGLGMPWCVASISTDGTDFLSDIGGAIIDQDSLGRARKKRLDAGRYIDRYDTYTLFKKMGVSLVESGVTGTNVGDIIIYFLSKP
jgi:hydroxypyruvate reductase/glycerate 2-kinase